MGEGKGGGNESHGFNKHRFNKVWEPHACQAIDDLLIITQLCDPVRQYLINGRANLHGNDPNSSSSQTKLIVYRPVALWGDQLPDGNDNPFLYGHEASHIDTLPLQLQDQFCIDFIKRSTPHPETLLLLLVIPDLQKDPLSHILVGFLG